MGNVVALTLAGKLFSIGTEVHVGWCPPGTSNPVDLPLVDRSVRFRHTSAKALALSGSFHQGLKAARGNGLIPHEPQKAAEERAVSCLEGSQAPGPGAGWFSSTYPT